MSERIAILPETEDQWLALRHQDVTSTEAAALFGLSPYSTSFDLWHKKAGNLDSSIKETKRMKWGTLLQDTIGRAIGEEQQWKVRRLNAYMRLPEARMGASFDFEIVSNERGPGILEIKNVDSLIFRDQWLQEDRTVEAPGHIEIQLQQQLHIANRSWGAIAVLVGGNDLRLLMRERYTDVGESLEEKIWQFWQSIEAGTPPAPDYPRDAKVICRLYGHAEPDKVYDGRTDVDLTALCAAYTEAHTRYKLAEEDKDVAKAKILQMIGDAERVIADGFKISAGLIGPTSYTVEKGGYRNFRVYPQKQKEQKTA